MTPEERARLILAKTLPEIQSRDEAIGHLFYVDPNNDVTRLHSIAAAVWILLNEQLERRRRLE